MPSMQAADGAVGSSARRLSFYNRVTGGLRLLKLRARAAAMASAVRAVVPVGEKKRVYTLAGVMIFRFFTPLKIPIFRQKTYLCMNLKNPNTMKRTAMAFAALLFAACGGGQSQSGSEASEPATAVVHGAEIALLPVDPQAGLTINEALQNRRSWREYAAEPLSLEELSGVLWAAAGVNRLEEGRLTAPSALALYPIRVYAFFAEGVYRYDAPAHKLVRVAEGDLRNLSAAQPFAVAAPLNLVYIADLSVYADREIPAEKVRYLCGQDAAGYAENVNLYTAGHGLKSITRGSAPADELLKALGLDPAQYFFALAQTVGK